MQRKELKSIYDNLDNALKKEWAANGNYSSYQGLYRYLKKDGESQAYEGILNSLILTIGQSKFNEMTGNSRNETKIRSITDLINAQYFKRDTIEMIFNTEDTDYLEKIKNDFKDFISACDNQLLKLKIKSEL